MPPTISSALIRRDPLAEDDWVQLIEHRRELLKPHLSSMTLQKLEDVSFCWSKDLRTHENRLDSLRYIFPALGGALLGGDLYVNAHDSTDLDTTGLFHWDPRYDELASDSEHLKTYIWGISRAGAWVLIEIALQRRERGDTPREIDIWESSPLTINNVVPWVNHSQPFLDILEVTNNWIVGLVQRRAEQHQKAVEILEVIRQENILLRTIIPVA